MRPLFEDLGTKSVDEVMELFDGISLTIANDILRDIKVPARQRMEFLKVLDEKPSQPQDETSSLRRCKRIPIVGLVIDAVFGEPPSKDAALTLYNTLGMLNALMLTVAMGLPMSIDAGGYEGAMEMFSGDGIYGGCAPDGSASFFITGFNAFTVQAVYYLAAALISCVLLICAINADEIETIADMSSWWTFGRWTTFPLMFLTVGGTVDTLNAWRYFLVLTQPNPYLLEHGCDEPGLIGAIGYPYSTENTWGWAFLFGGIVVNLSMVGTTMTASFACWNHERVRSEQYTQWVFKLNSILTNGSFICPEPCIKGSSNMLVPSQSNTDSKGFCISESSQNAGF
jgi:hypothetical protein